MRRMTFDERRSELIDAAIRVISRDGLAAATTRAIVAEAHMPQGALFYIFPSRQALIEAVVAEITDRERISAMHSLDLLDPESTLQEIIARAMDAYLHLVEADPGQEIALLEVAVHAMRRDPGAGRAQWAIYRQAVVDAMVFVAAAKGLRWTLPVGDIAHMITASIDGITLSWLNDRDGAAARAQIDLLAGMYAALAIPADRAEASRRPADRPPNHQIEESTGER